MAVAETSRPFRASGKGRERSSTTAGRSEMSVRQGIRPRNSCFPQRSRILQVIASPSVDHPNPGRCNRLVVSPSVAAHAGDLTWKAPATA